jgi:hypothetical protein
VKESTLQSYCEIGEGRYTAHGRNESTTTSPRLVSINCRQLVLHSVDVDRLIGEDHRCAPDLGTGGTVGPRPLSP